MNLVSRLLSGLFMLTALLLVVASFSADRLLRMCIPVDQYGNVLSLLELQRQGQELTRKFESFSQRFRAKQRVMKMLIARDMTLSDAAIEFRSINENAPTWYHPFRQRPKYDDGVGWCREVIEWTMNQVRVEESPHETEALRQRLETELQEHMDKYGNVALPD
jgi:hypothetical protein